ncbi:NEDD4-binding protein 2 [Echinops telfairi]|uniref:NEDD4-binding protein 2 n=1 Tax=Echinops telfairi TaxID=9371 RepID=A0AC55CL53_ECHTE|nr:NEDD4-binding protein 2 [Echinops telfairi]
MPRRRKNLGGSPFRRSLNTKEVDAARVTPPPSICETEVDQNDLFTNISEMFSDLDPDVVYLMLSECDFKVDSAMDCLLELSCTDTKKEESSPESSLASESQECFTGSKIMEKDPEKENVNMPITEAFDCFMQGTSETLDSFSNGQVFSPLPLQDVDNLNDPGNQGFLMPVVATAADWIPANYLFPSPVIPLASGTHKEGMYVYQEQEAPVSQILRKKKTSYVGQVLVLLRGLPGSGKSFLARTLQEDNPGGVILSTDDYFCVNGQYQFDVKYLKEAHEWNQHCAKEAFEKKVSPIIIDNTNLQAWEMRPYVALSQKYKYKVLFREPDTWWKFKPKELARRNIHGVSKEKIARMLDHYQHFVSVPIIMGSLIPRKTERIEVCVYSCENKSTSPKVNEDSTLAREGNVLSSSLKDLDLTAEKKLELTRDMALHGSISFLTEANLDQGRKEISGVTPNIQSAFMQQDLDMPSSDPESHICPVVRSEKEEPGEGASAKQCSKTDGGGLVAGVSLSQEDCNFVKTTLLQTECSLPSEAWEERPIVKQKAFGKQQSKSNLETFPRHEVSDFVGDWPVNKTISQRTKRNRKEEKASSAQSDTKYTPLQAPRLWGASIYLGRDCIQDGRSAHDSVEDGKKFWCDDAPESFNGIKQDIFTSTWENIPSSLNSKDSWPPLDSLAQRKPRRRISKACGHEPTLEFGTSDHGSEMSSCTPRGGTSPKEQETLSSSLLDSSEMLASEGTPESKICLREVKHDEQGSPGLSFLGSAPTGPGVVDAHTRAAFPEETSKGVPEIETGTGVCTQTEPQDFALLWKIKKSQISVSDSVEVLTGRPDGFKPEAFNINPKLGGQEMIPYRVMHEKSTHVEESELMAADDAEKLDTLCEIFESVASEVLEDLYEKCNKDILWATTLLLDSEHKLCEYTASDNHLTSNDSPTGPSGGLDPEATVIPKDITEGSDSTVPALGPGAAISDIPPQPAFQGEVGTTEQAERQQGETELAERERGDTEQAEKEEQTIEREEKEEGTTGQAEMSALSPCAAGGLKSARQPLPTSQGGPSGIQSRKPSFSDALRTTTTKDMSDTEKQLVEVGDGMHSLSLSDTLDSVPSATNLESKEENNLTDPCEVKGNENIPKDHVGFQTNTEECVDKDVREMEKILMSGDSLSAGVSENGKTEMMRHTPVTAKHVTIECLELALPLELAFQLCELFGPVGIESECLTVEDCIVPIDLNLAKAIYEKWKDSVTEKQRQEEIASGRPVPDPSLVEQKSSQRTGRKMQRTLAASEMVPVPDCWNTQYKIVSLREIMSEEMAIQEKESLRRQSLMFVKDFATKLKEKELFKLFPTINHSFLMDIFQNHNYCLEPTVKFLNAILEGEPVKRVIAGDFVHSAENTTSRTTQKHKDKKTKKPKETEGTQSEQSLQDLEYPIYEDYRAEALLHQQKRMDYYMKANEAYQLGQKNVATFYAQQGSIHDQKMKEANHLAAVTIFASVNASLLPQNVLDLHGLHVDEAIAHLMAVLHQKTEEFRQSGGKPYLSVITGRGNHSLGGVARIKPAVIKYLTSHGFKFSEIEPGCLKVMLK